MNILTKVAAWAGITFTRNSAASRQDGSQVAANAPRLETGAFGSAMMIEEGTTNLCLMDTETAAAANWTSDATAETIAISSAVSFSGAKSVAYTYGGTGSSNIHLSGTAKFTQTTATAFTTSFKVKYANGSPVTGLSGYLYVSNNSNVNGPCTITQLRDGWYLCTYTRTGLAAGAVSLIGLYGLPTNTTVYIDDWQVEARSFATSYVFGTRPAEICSISTVGLLAGLDPFTIEAWVMPILPPAGSVAAIVSDWTKMYLAINAAGGLRISWTEGDQKILDSSSAPFQAGRRCHVAVTYDGLYIAGYVNGVQVIPTTQAVLGEQWSGTLKIGNLNSSYLLNGLIEDLRISSVARSAADLAARARRHNYLDASTSVILALAGSGYLLKRDNNSVLLADPPLRESSEQQEIPQASGHDSDGAVYVYDKGLFRRVDHSMVYGQIPSYTLGLLKTFLAVTVRGSRDLFTWIDHKTAPHTVRFASRMTSADRFNDLSRVAIDLEEQISMPVPAAGTFAQMLARKAGVAPVWILKMTVNAVDYYLSDCTVTVNVGGWNATTRPWISRWGDLREGVTNALGEIRISDLDLDVIIDPAASPNMEDLATGYPLENAPVMLYLWFASCTEAPVEMFRGYVRDVDIPDDTAVSLTIENELSRLANAYVGTRVDTTTYPSADPDDVGKVVPIVYGSLVKLPAVCVEGGFASSITADIDTEVTSFYFSDNVPTAYSLVGRSIWIDNEKMYVTAATYSNVTVTRGYGGTVATAHDKGSVVIEDRTGAPLVYLVADHPVASITKIYTRVNGIDVDITNDCTAYLGSAGSEHASYPGKACISITNIPAIQKKTGLAIFEIAHSHNSAASSTENTTLTLPVALTYYGTYPQPSGYPYVPGLCYYRNVTFPNSGGSRSSVAYTITITPTTTRSGVKILAVINGVCLDWWDCSLVSGSPLTFTFTATGGLTPYDSFDIVQVGAGAGSYFNVTVSSRQVYLSSVPSSYASTGASLSGNSVADVLVGEMLLVNVARTIDIPGIMDDLVSRGGLSGATTLIGNLSETYKPRLYDFVTTPGHLATYFSAVNATLATNANGLTVTATDYDPILIFTSAYASTRFTRIKLRFRRTSGAGAWDGKVFWANSQHSYDANYCKTIPQPANLSAWNEVDLDMTTATGGADYLAYTVNSLRFDLSAGPADVYEIAWIEIVRTNTEGIMAGAITEYRPALEWLNLIAFQCRCWFRRDLGVSRLIMRPDTVTSSRTINAVAMTGDGRRQHRRRKVDPADVVNRINLLYNRDWTKTGDEAYKSAYTISDAGSIATHGEREQPDLFRFDFVAGASSATPVADYYLAHCKNRPWQHEIELFLDSADIEWGDGVTLGFAPGDPVGTVIEVGPTLGGARQIDKVKITVET